MPGLFQRLKSRESEPVTIDGVGDSPHDSVIESAGSSEKFEKNNAIYSGRDVQEVEAS